MFETSYTKNSGSGNSYCTYLNYVPNLFLIDCKYKLY